MLEKIVVISLALAILLQTYVVKRLVGTWSFPACVFGLFWFVMTMLPITVMLEAPVSPGAMTYLLATCLCFSAGAIRNDWGRAFATGRANYRQGTFATPFLRGSFLTLFGVAMFTHVTNMIVQGFTFADLAYNVVDTAGVYTQRRYDDRIIVNIFAQLAIIATYLVAIVGGLLFADKERLIKTPVLVLLSFAPSLFLMVAQSAKGAIFLSIALFIGSVLCVTARTGWRSLIGARTLSYGLAFAAAVVVLVAISFIARLGSAYTGDLLTRYFVSYSSAHLFGFADWFSWYVGERSIQYYSNIPTSHGFYTFMALFRLAGDERYVPIGTYDEYFDYSFFLSGNLYTIYRGMITDFGIAGSLLAVALFSWVVHGFFRRMLVAKKAPFATAVSIMTVGAIYHSYLASLGMYLSIYVCLIAAWSVLQLNGFLARPARADPLAPAARLQLLREARR